MLTFIAGIVAVLLVVWYFYIAYNIAEDSMDIIDRIKSRLVRSLVRIVCGLTWGLWAPFWVAISVFDALVTAYKNKRGIFK